MNSVIFAHNTLELSKKFLRYGDVDVSDSYEVKDIFVMYEPRHIDEYEITMMRNGFGDFLYTLINGCKLGVVFSHKTTKKVLTILSSVIYTEDSDVGCPTINIEDALEELPIDDPMYVRMFCLDADPNTFLKEWNIFRPALVNPIERGFHSGGNLS